MCCRIWIYLTCDNGICLWQVSNYKVSVFDSYGNGIPSQIVSLSHASERLRQRYLKSIYGNAISENLVYILAFETECPPLGYSTYYIKPSQNDTCKFLFISFEMFASLDCSISIMWVHCQFLQSTQSDKRVQIKILY